MKADLTATPTITNGQVVSWDLCYVTSPKNDCGTGKTSSPYPKVNLLAGSGDHKIKIDIVNGGGITFSQDPIWIQQDIKPTSHVIAPTSQINPGKITGAGTTELTFHDANVGDAMLLKYRLNFANGSGLMTIDPDITNGGKGMTWYSQYSSLLIAGGVVIALALLIWRINITRRGNAARQSGTGTDSSI